MNASLVHILKMLHSQALGRGALTLRIAASYLSYAASFLRTDSCIVSRRQGARDLTDARNIAVFVHFDRQGVVHDFVYHYIRNLREAGFSIIFVSNSENLKSTHIKTLEALCGLIVVRKNYGLDFAAYRDGIAQIPDISQLDTLLLANDSVYGPLHNIHDMLSKMKKEKAHVWGATDSWEIRFHLQSYFVLMHKEVLVSDIFRKFWNNIRPVQSKTWIVRKYEVGLTRALQQGGFRCQAAFPYREICHRIMEAVLDHGILNDESIGQVRKDYISRKFYLLNAGIPVNSSHFFWDYLIANMKFPFLKRELLQKNPAHIPFLPYWDKVINGSTDYDTDIILRHLEMSMKNRSI